MKWTAIILSLFMASASLALTPQERAWAIQARTYVQKAKEDAIAQSKQIEETDRQNEMLDQIAKGQQSQIVELDKEIDQAHKHEEALAKYNAYAKPIVDKVTRYWGIGGILFGFGLLAKHLFILAAVIAVLAIVVFVASFFFPAIGVFLRASMAFVSALIRRIGDIFKRK